MNTKDVIKDIEQMCISMLDEMDYIKSNRVIKPSLKVKQLRELRQTLNILESAMDQLRHIGEEPKQDFVRLVRNWGDEDGGCKE